MTLTEARNLGKPWMNEEYRITCIQTFIPRLEGYELDTYSTKLKHYCLKYDFLRKDYFISKEKFVKTVQELEQVSPLMAQAIVDAVSY